MQRFDPVTDVLQLFERFPRSLSPTLHRSPPPPPPPLTNETGDVIAVSGGSGGSGSGDDEKAEKADPCILVTGLYVIHRVLVNSGAVSTPYGGAGTGRDGRSCVTAPLSICPQPGSPGSFLVGQRYVLRHLSKEGKFTRVAGSGATGNTDGIGPAASFSGITGLAFTPSRWIDSSQPKYAASGGKKIHHSHVVYVVDHNHGSIRRVSMTSLRVSTLVNGFHAPYSLVFSKLPSDGGRIAFISTSRGIFRIDFDGNCKPLVLCDGSGGKTAFSTGWSKIDASSSGVLYACTTSHPGTIFSIDQTTGIVSRIAGSGIPDDSILIDSGGARVPVKDGDSLRTAVFGTVTDVLLSGDGRHLYVVDSHSPGSIRSISLY